jgi:phosphate-selective porin OprO and OprP
MRVNLVKLRNLPTSTGAMLTLGVASLYLVAAPANGADQALLDALLKNGVINRDQYSKLLGSESASNGNELLEILKGNGAITKDQFSTLAKKETEKRSPEKTAGAPAAPAKDSAHVKLGENGLEFASDDGNFKAKIGGRAQVDSQINWNDKHGPAGTDLSDGVGFRRARLYTEGTLFKDYEYRFEYDFARNNGGTQGITDAFLKYVAFKPLAITIGQQNEGKSMESVMSNNYLTFIERSLPNNAFIEQGANSKYQLGITAETYDKVFDRAYTLRGGLTTESVGAPGPGNSSDNSQGTTNAAGGTNSNGTNINRNAFSGNTSYQLVGRGTFLPYKDQEGNLIHTGVWGSWRSINNNYNQNGTVRTGGWAFQSQPDSNVDRTNWINTGNLTNAKTSSTHHEVDNIGMVGAELAGAYGPAHFGAEYMQAQISGTGYSGADTLEGFYAYGGFFLTGETRPYDEKRGTWGRLVPKQNFIGGSGWGAWEVAARYDLMDMNTKHINGGALGIGTFALNWYLTPRIRLMTDWVHVFSTNNSSTCAGFPAQGANAGIGCFKGLSPNIWETAVRFDF